MSSGLSKPLICLPLESESPIFKLFKKESFGFVFILLACFNIPLADVLALDNFSAHIISSKLTSPPEAISLQIASSLNLYWVESIRKTHLIYLFSLCMLHYLPMKKLEIELSNLLLEDSCAIPSLLSYFQSEYCPFTSTYIKKTCVCLLPLYGSLQ